MRIAPLLPLIIPVLTAPAAAGDYSICLTAAQSVSCLIEQAEFEYQRNTEVNASIARVQRVRAFEAARNAEIAASIARVESRRQRQLELQQNALIEASIAAANAERERRFAANQNELATASIERVEVTRKRLAALSTTHCKTRFSRTPRCLAEREQRFAKQQNALASASAERVKAARERTFAAARNTEITASLAAVARARATQQLAAGTSHCAQNPTTPRCAAEQARELQASLTHCKSAYDASPRCTLERNRDFTLARNAEINASIAAVALARATGQLASAGTCAQNDLSPGCEYQFQAARNAEINASLAAVARARTLARGNVARPDTGNSGYAGNGGLETGALPGLPATLPEQRSRSDLRSSISIEPCRRSGTPFGPLHFTQGADIDADMKPELERLVDMAQSCPGMRIEIHGYSDGTGSAFTNRSMAQARAQAIANYLITSGVAPNRVAAIGRGAVDWVLPYAKGIDRTWGRRVEFIIKDPAMDAAARQVMYDLAELLDPTYVPAVADLSP